ncbi:pectate lyase [Fulvivirga kasyanovii]|uniref:pectate lyase n=1 Tax=Fulvivirga kasyanovii TaxID=396812 RepID=UPI001FE86BBC|nr:pectate lyase [Fulvivirga kasyanovii]
MKLRIVKIFRNVLIGGAIFLPAIISAQQLAFPGAEGFGKYATGGRGGKVLIVTNLNDSGPGSLREAIKAKGPRIITFAVSGNIALESDLPIDNGELTIAGQSAPGDGICIKNYPVRVSADNVIIRYIRFRLGDEEHVEDDAFKGRGNRNVIIDHCSVSWSTDECASFYKNSDFTLQWCIISESLSQSVHKKGAHGYGGIWGGVNTSFHHNLIAHHSSRNPRFSGSSSTPNSPEELVDFRNNVIYNWGHNSVYGGEKGRYNMVNNYYKAGPATKKSIKDRIVNPSEPYGKFYVHGNYVAGSEKVTENNWAGGVQCENPESTKAEEPFEAIPINTQTAEEAYESVLASAGASHCRDAVDKRIVEEVKKGTASFNNGIIDSQKDVGGWPELKTKKAPEDTDNDGMPDKWETKYGLNPKDSNDAVAYGIDNEYTNIEVYLNQLVK